MFSGKIVISLITPVIGLHLVSGGLSKPAPAAQSKRVNRSTLKSRGSGSAIVGGQTQGPTPFIVQIDTTVNPIASLVSVQFSVAPKAGSVTKPISATYSSNYLRSRSYLDQNTGSVIVPVFGLYENYSNTVTLTFFFNDNTSQQNNVTVVTPEWSDTCGVYKNPVVLQARTTANLSYDYVMLKNPCGDQSPVIMDTDGQVRWVGTGGFNAFASIFFANGIYISSNPPNGSAPTAISRIDFDGIVTPIHDYSDIGVTWTGHHNADPGRDGMLFDVNTTTATESVILEVDSLGNVLNTWNFADIISQAMVAGGDDPSQFVGSSSEDWFHNNAATYRKSDNTLIASSRENFVIAVDYDTKQIKWILGDPTKQWYQFPSLRQYALMIDPNSLPPIGQHAVSITLDDNLLLFDNGTFSFDHTPPGDERTYSAPRKYRINTETMTATEVWNFPNGQSRHSPICSSVYEDAPLNYFVDYANLSDQGSFFPSGAELLGLNRAGALVFDYSYPTNSSACSTAWNAIPIHLEDLRYTSVHPLKAVSRKVHGLAGTFDLNLPLTGGTAIECRNGDYQVVVTFPTNVALNGASVTHANNGTASVSGSPIVSGNTVTVNLTDVSTGQTLMVNLLGVSDGTNADDVSIPVSILVGDSNQDRFTDAVDVSLTKSQSGKPVTYGNFREDANGDGFIDAVDVSLLKSKSGTSLP